MTDEDGPPQEAMRIVWKDEQERRYDDVGPHDRVRVVGPEGSPELVWFDEKTGETQTVYLDWELVRTIIPLPVDGVMRGRPRGTTTPAGPRPTCQGTKSDGTKCRHPAKAGDDFCGYHTDQLSPEDLEGVIDEMVTYITHYEDEHNDSPTIDQVKAAVPQAPDAEVEEAVVFSVAALKKKAADERYA